MTTPAEHLFVTGGVDSMLTQAKGLGGAQASSPRWESRSDRQVIAALRRRKFSLPFRYREKSRGLPMTPTLGTFAASVAESKRVLMQLR